MKIQGKSILCYNASRMLTREEAIEVARQCFDPEIPVNIWDLGLVYDIQLQESTETALIKMTLTSQHCPAAQSIPEDLKKKLLATGKIKEAKIDLVFDPPWTPERINEEGKKKLGI